MSHAKWMRLTELVHMFSPLASLVHSGEWLRKHKFRNGSTLFITGWILHSHFSGYVRAVWEAGTALIELDQFMASSEGEVMFVANYSVNDADNTEAFKREIFHVKSSQLKCFNETCFHFWRAPNHKSWFMKKVRKSSPPPPPEKASTHRAFNLKTFSEQTFFPPFLRWWQQEKGFS